MANNNIQARLADLRQRNAARTGRDGQEPAGSRPAGGSIQDRLAELRQRNAQRQVKEQSTPTADRARLGLATGGNPVSSSLTRFTRERESEAMARTGSEAEALKLQMDTLSAQKAALEEGLPKLRAAEQPSEVARESLMRTAQGWSQRQELGQEPERGSDRVSAQIEALELERSALLPQYYAAKNEATLRRMEGDAALKSLYAQAKALREDLDRAGLVETGTGTENGEAYRAAWDGLKEKYGVSRAAELPALHERLLREFGALEEQLAAQGVDYEYLRAYEQMAEDRAAWVEKQAETEAYAREHPVMASVESVLKSPMQGLDLLSLGTPGAGRNDPDSPDTYVPLNVYGMDVSNFVNTVRGTVSEEIEKNTDWELFGQNVASFLYQTGMSVADSAAQVALFGPGATYLMGASAAANQAREVIERGGTNRQALLSGLAAGAAEALFEKVSVERLLGERSVRSMRDLLAETLKQAGTEASEEMLTEVSNLLSDAAIMGGGSSFAAMVDRHRQEGLSEEAARRRAFLDCLSQVSLAGVGGALSGGVMGGTVRGANYLSGAWNQVQNARASRPTNEQLLSSLNQRLSQPGQVEADLRPYSVLNGTENSAVDALQERTENAFREELRRQLTGSPAVEDAGQNNTASTGEAESTVINTDPTVHTHQEQAVIEEYQTGTDDALKETFESYLNNPKQGFSRFNISNVSERQAADASQLLGGTYTGYKNAINSNGIQHILNEHGPEGTADHSLADLNDIARMGYVLENYDNVEIVTYDSGDVDLSREFRTKDNQPAPMLKFSKKVNGTYYVVEAIPESKYKKFWVVTAYMQKTDGGTQAPNANGPENTPNASLASSPSVSDATVPQLAHGVKGQSARNGPESSAGSVKNIELTQQSGEVTGTPPASPDRASALSGPIIADSTAEGNRGNTENGGLTNGGQGQPAGQQPGDGVPDGGQGRLSGAGTGEQTGGLGTGAAGSVTPAEQSRAAIGRQNRGKHLRSERVSSLDLGLPNGTETPSVSVVEEADWDAEMHAAADRVQYETGLPVTYVLGSIPVRDAGGGVRRVRGVYGADRIVLQADNLRVAVDQIADHEIFHDKAFQTPGLVLEIESRIIERYSREEFERVAEAYVERLRGVVDVPEGATGEEIHEAYLAVKEEILADAYAGINAFSAHAERFQGTVNEVLEERGLGRGRENTAATDRKTGPPSDTGIPQNHAERSLFSMDEETEQEYNAGRAAELTAEEEAALLDYKSGGSYQINAALRDGYPLDQMQYRTVEALDAALERLPPYQGTVYRRVGFDSIGGREAMDAFLKEHDAGKIVGYPAYTSTSTDPEGYTLDGDLTVTLVMESAAGRNLEGYGNNFESEILFPRDSEFLVERRGTDGQGKPIIYMREVAEHGIARPGGRVRPEERGQAVQRVQEAEKLYGNMSGIPGRNPQETSVREQLPGLRAGGDRQGRLSSPAGEVTEDGTGQLYSQEQYGEMQGVQETQERDVHLRGVPEVDSGRGDGQRLPGLRAEGDAEGEGLSSREARYSVDEEQGAAEQAAGDEAEQEKKREQPAAAEGRNRRRRTRKPVAESLPIIARQDLKQNLLNLFSVPEGMRTELGTVIDQYADRLLKNGKLTQADRDAFFDRMYGAGVMTMPAEEYFAVGRQAVKGGKVYVPVKDQHEFGDDWNDFRKRAFANGIYLTNNPADQGVDQWNAELGEMLPGLFDDGELDSRTILERIVQVAEEGRDQKLTLEEYAAELAGQGYVTQDEILDNLERQMDWALRTFAEKAQLEVRLRDRTGAKLAEEREKFSQSAQRQREREMSRRAKERDWRREQIQRQRENRALRELQQKTLKQLQWLSKNRNRAPAELQAAFDEVLGDIDLYAVGAANEMNWSRKYDATWKDLAQLYEAAKEADPNFLPSKELERIKDRLNADKIADLDVDALSDLYKAAVGLRTEFYNRNNVINDEMNRLFAEVYTDAKAEIETAPGGYTGKGLDKFMNLDQLTPMNVMERMGGWDPQGAFYSMAKQLEQGERDVRRYTVRANQRLADFLTEHEDWVKKADGQGKDGIWYEIEVPELLELGMGDKPVFGDTVKVYMTPSMKVHMYLESKNYDNLRHMTGGRTFADRELYSRGERQEAFAQGRTIRLAPETVKGLVANLTEEEAELARILEDYYNGFAKGEINRVSNILYGYDKAQSRSYAPIYTNRNYVKSEIGIFDTTAEGVGNLKSRQYAKNPSYNISAFDAFERHVEQTARFVGMAIPARNWQTLLNWREQKNSMGDVITHKWGEESKRYIEDLLNRLQGGSAVERDTVGDFANKVLSNYISAVFGANPGIVLKQLGSVPLASAWLEGRNFPSPAQIARIDRDLIGRYTGDLAWRTMGYATPETKQLKENPNWTQTNRFTRFTFGGGAITAMDGWAASVLWPWAENKVRRDFPDLEAGTQEQIDAGQSPFYRKVAEAFNEAVARSQSVSDEIHQGMMRKSRNPITRAFTLFKSDSAQGYNALRQKIGEARYYERAGDAENARQARKAVGAAFVSLIGGNLWTALVSFLIALWKNKGKYYRDDEGELTFESAAREMVMDLTGSLFGIVAGGEELMDILGNVLTGDTWYGIDTPGLEQLTDIIELLQKETARGLDALKDAVDVVNSGGDLGEYLKRNGNDILGGIHDLAEAAGTYIPGIPISNLEAYILGTVKWISPELGTAYDDLLKTAEKSGLSGLEGDALKQRVGSILSGRLNQIPEGAAAELAGLYEAGYTQAVPGDTPARITVNGEEQELGAYQQQVYETVWRESVEAPLWNLLEQDWYAALDGEARAKVLAKLYDYGAQSAKSALFDEFQADSFVEEIGAYQAAGLDAADWLEAWRKFSEIEDSGANASSRATEFAYWADSQGYTPEQARVVKDSFTVFSHIPVEPERYGDLQAAGLSDSEARTLTAALAELEPLEGKKAVSDMQRLRTIADAGLDREKTVAAMGTVLGDDMATESGGKSQYALLQEALDDGYTVDEWLELKEAGCMTESTFDKVRISGQYDISPEQYIRYREMLERTDAINEDPEKRNKSIDQDEAAAAVNGMLGLTNAQKAVLWQLQNKSWKPNRNPFDTAAGQAVYDYLNREELPGLTGGGALPGLSLPMLEG